MFCPEELQKKQKKKANFTSCMGMLMSGALILASRALWALTA